MNEAIRLSAHIGYLYGDLPLRDRVRAAAKDGFTAIEHPQPHAIPAAEMRQLLADEGLVFAQVAAGIGDAKAGEKGLAALPGRQQDFREAFLEMLDYAVAVGIPLIHPMAGVPSSDRAADLVADTYFANIDFAVSESEKAGVGVLVEGISHQAVPGYYMHKLSQALALSRSYHAGAVQVLLDSFHAAANGEDALAAVASHASRIGHVHIADFPGRHEPGTGNLDLAGLLEAIKNAGFRGAVGFEYIPHSTTQAGLTWLADWRRRVASPQEKVPSQS
jgi:hydroxypyruvate isomerase